MATTKKLKEYAVTGPPAGPPVHPGSILREDVLPALRVSVKQAAEDLGISRQTLHAILAEKAAITPEMAVRIGKFCGNGPALWLSLQHAHDLWHAERSLRDVIKKIPTRKEAA